MLPVLSFLSICPCIFNVFLWNYILCLFLYFLLIPTSLSFVSISLYSLFLSLSLSASFFSIRRTFVEGGKDQHHNPWSINFRIGAHKTKVKTKTFFVNTFCSFLTGLLKLFLTNLFRLYSVMTGFNLCLVTMHLSGKRWTTGWGLWVSNTVTKERMF